MAERVATGWLVKYWDRLWDKYLEQRYKKNGIPHFDTYLGRVLKEYTTLSELETYLEVTTSVTTRENSENVHPSK